MKSTKTKARRLKLVSYQAHYNCAQTANRAKAQCTVLGHHDCRQWSRSEAIK